MHWDSGVRSGGLSGSFVDANSPLRSKMSETRQAGIMMLCQCPLAGFQSRMHAVSSWTHVCVPLAERNCQWHGKLGFARQLHNVTASHCQWAVRKGAFFSATASSTAPPRPRLGARTPGLSVISSGPRACRARGLLACRPAGLGFCCHCPTAVANAKLGSLCQWEPSTVLVLCLYLPVGLPGLPSNRKLSRSGGPKQRTGHAAAGPEPCFFC